MVVRLLAAFEGVALLPATPSPSQPSGVGPSAPQPAAAQRQSSGSNSSSSSGGLRSGQLEVAYVQGLVEDLKRKGGPGGPRELLLLAEGLMRLQVGAEGRGGWRTANMRACMHAPI